MKQEVKPVSTVKKTLAQSKSPSLERIVENKPPVQPATSKAQPAREKKTQVK